MNDVKSRIRRKNKIIGWSAVIIVFGLFGLVGISSWFVRQEEKRRELEFAQKRIADSVRSYSFLPKLQSIGQRYDRILQFGGMFSVSTPDSVKQVIRLEERDLRAAMDSCVVGSWQWRNNEVERLAKDVQGKFDAISRATSIAVAGQLASFLKKEYALTELQVELADSVLRCKSGAFLEKNKKASFEQAFGKFIVPPYTSLELMSDE